MNQLTISPVLRGPAHLLIEVEEVRESQEGQSNSAAAVTGTRRAPPRTERFWAAGALFRPGEFSSPSSVHARLLPSVRRMSINRPAS
jgi:hypothetical protein